MAEPIRVAVVGLGFMGRTHLKAFQRADEAGFANRLVAVCDADEGRRRGEVVEYSGNIALRDSERLFDPAEVKGYEYPPEVFGDPNVDLVSICTPTNSHVELAMAALRNGKHVLVEKPVALTSTEVGRLADAASESDRRCMPAMCMRFWPAWAWLKERVVDGSLGAVRSASFRRLGTQPTWGFGAFYANDEVSGGALVDLHIHDADFIRHCFGAPDRVQTAGDLHHVTTHYRYDDGPVHVVAEGGWDQAPGFPFRMEYTVNFEKATADFSLARDPQLLLCRDGEATPVEVDDTDGYDGEVRHLLDAIRDPSMELRATVDDAVELAKMLEAERASLG